MLEVRRRYHVGEARLLAEEGRSVRQGLVLREYQEGRGDKETTNRNEGEDTMTTDTKDRIKLKEVTALTELAASYPELPAKLEEEAIRKAEAGATRVVGGFKFHDSAWIDDKLREAKEARLYDVSKFEEKKKAITEKLEKIDIKPLAVVPANHWDEITKLHDLVTLSPSLDGKVSVGGEVAHQAGSGVGDRIDVAASSFAAVGSVLAFGRGFYIGTGSDSLGQFMLSIAVDSWMHAAFFLLATSILITSVVKPYFLGRVLDRWIETHSYADLLRAVTEGRSYSGHRAVLRLPDPPADVVSLLRKLVAANWQFEVTAEAEAIALNPPARDLFHASYKIREQELEALRRDPIICVREGSVVAVLAQFGDFEWEKAVVEDVVWSKPLPKSHEY